MTRSVRLLPRGGNRRQRGTAVALVLACVTLAAPPRAAHASDTLYCDLSAGGTPNCLFPFRIDSDWDVVKSAVGDLQGAFSTLSGVYSAVTTAVSVFQLLNGIHVPSLDDKVNQLLNEVAAIRADTQAIIRTLTYTNAAIDANTLTAITNFVADQTSEADAALDGLHQWYALGSPPSLNPAVLLTTQTAAAVYDLERGRNWTANPLPDGGAGPFEWRYAMLAYLHVVAARVAIISAFNPSATIPANWGGEIHDRAAFILGKVAQTRQWTSDRCQAPLTNPFGIGVGTSQGTECASDQWMCMAYDYYGSCVDWYWDSYCPAFVTHILKKCDYATSDLVSFGPSEPVQTNPFHTGDDVELRSLHALGLDNWMYSAAQLHALAVGATYAGCHSDAGTRALPTRLIANRATVASCVGAAKAAGLNYAGLQYGGECWGGNSVGWVQQPDMSCATPCDADAGEMCGGTWANSVYQAISSPDEAPATNTGYHYQGCYTTGPILGTLIIAGNATVAGCAVLGKTLGYPYVGLTGGGACYAGYSPGSVRQSELACTQPCTADPNQVCGGAGTINVIDLQDRRCPYGDCP